MTYAPSNMIEKVLGKFVESDFCKTFEYIHNPENVTGFVKGKEVLFPHKIFVGLNQETRFALIKKTVAYVIVDEAENGWVIEKWHIKNHRSYPD